MDENFIAINRRAIAQGIKNSLALKAAQLLELTKSSTFETDFYGDPGTPMIDKLIEVNTFMQEVVVASWVSMKQQADTPGKIEEVFADLTDKGVSFPDGAP